MDEVHIIPNKDIWPHIEDKNCWCVPIFKSGGWDNADLYVHNNENDRKKA